jgi:hypothetical protein
MKLLTFKRLVGLAAIGGVAYIHKQRGGKWTLASITDTLRQLWSSAVTTLAPVQQRTPEALERVANLTETTARKPAEAHQGQSSSGHSKRKDETGRH